MRTCVPLTKWYERVVKWYECGGVDFALPLALHRVTVLVPIEGTRLSRVPPLSSSEAGGKELDSYHFAPPGDPMLPDDDPCPLLCDACGRELRGGPLDHLTREEREACPAHPDYTGDDPWPMTPERRRNHARIAGVADGLS
jgi:hypothetical protein